jgi:hypothetical protein
MNRLATLVGTLSFACALTAAGAQQRPDFTGEWTRVADSAATARPAVATTGDAAFRRGEMGSGWGSPITIMHEPDRLMVEYEFFSAYDLQPRLRFIYALDGSESRNSLMIGHASSGQRSRVVWAGDTLVITTRVPGPAGADGRAGIAEVRQALALASPHVLHIETTRLGVLGGATMATRTTYTKR